MSHQGNAEGNKNAPYVNVKPTEKPPVYANGWVLEQLQKQTPPSIRKNTEHSPDTPPSVSPFGPKQPSPTASHTKPLYENIESPLSFQQPEPAVAAASHHPEPVDLLRQLEAQQTQFTNALDTGALTSNDTITNLYETLYTSASKGLCSLDSIDDLRNAFFRCSKNHIQRIDELENPTPNQIAIKNMLKAMRQTILALKKSQTAPKTETLLYQTPSKPKPTTEPSASMTQSF